MTVRKFILKHYCWIEVVVVPVVAALIVLALLTWLARNPCALSVC